MSDPGNTRRDCFRLGAAAAAGVIALRLGAATEREAGASLRPNTKVPFNPATAMAMSTVIIGVDHAVQLEENIGIARDFLPLSNSQLQALEGKARSSGQAIPVVQAVCTAKSQLTRPGGLHVLGGSYLPRALPWW